MLLRRYISQWARRNHGRARKAGSAPLDELALYSSHIGISVDELDQLCRVPTSNIPTEILADMQIAVCIALMPEITMVERAAVKRDIPKDNEPLPKSGQFGRFSQ